jgi:uncharacterized protein YuzE
MKREVCAVEPINPMKLHCYPETDSLYIALRPVQGSATREVAHGLVVDLDGHGEVVGFDIDNASKRLGPSKVETVALPLAGRAGFKPPLRAWRLRPSVIS